MRMTLPAALLTVLLGTSLGASLAACGGDGDAGGSGDAASSPPEATTSGTATPGEESGSPSGDTQEGPVEHRLLRVISTTLGGGSVDEQAVDLGAPGGVDDLVAGLESGMPEQVRREVRRVAARPATQAALDDGARLYGAVAWIGCETPRDIGVVRRHGGIEVKPFVPGKGTIECLAPVTSVVLFTA